MMPEGPVWLTGLLAMVAGAAVGSFIGTALVRLPADRSILAGRSACDVCGVDIGARDLVPLWSWLALRGRCRACGAAIGVWQPWCEVAGALIGAGAVVFAPDGLALPAMLLGWQLLLLGVIDARHLWLPRLLVATLAISGAGFALLRAWQEASLLPLGIALSGAALGFVTEAPTEIAEALAQPSR